MKLATYQKRNGIEKKRFCHKNSNDRAMMRKQRTCDRLEEQLKSGVKPYKKGQEGIEPLKDENGKDAIFIQLSNEDITRIKKEISTLKTKIK